jgi:hypothetical protein
MMKLFTCVKLYEIYIISRKTIINIHETSIILRHYVIISISNKSNIIN